MAVLPVNNRFVRTLHHMFIKRHYHYEEMALLIDPFEENDIEDMASSSGEKDEEIYQNDYCRRDKIDTREPQTTNALQESPKLNQRRNAVGEERMQYELEVLKHTLLSKALNAWF